MCKLQRSWLKCSHELLNLERIFEVDSFCIFLMNDGLFSERYNALQLIKEIANVEKLVESALLCCNVDSNYRNRLQAIQGFLFIFEETNNETNQY